ncbi:MAG TPA: hypothetical protein PLV85_01990, partial [Polyangiaceae bacterium]|nr:hypothetical protein [Polyangiaceae bacterium]
ILMRRIVLSQWLATMVVATVVCTSQAKAQKEPSDEESSSSTNEKLRSFPIIETGPQAGFRTGFAKGMGKLSAQDGELGGGSHGFIPFWLDLGYRVHPNVYVGAYGQFGWVLLRKGVLCDGEYVKCSGQNYRVGASFHYHFIPDGDADPWVGLGAGYEWYFSNVSFATSGVPNMRNVFHGPEWVNVSVGLDIKKNRQGGVGPFVALAVGQYLSRLYSDVNEGEVVDVAESIVATEMHQWLFFGIQGSFFDSFH